MTPSDRLEAYRWAKENFEKHDDGPFLCNMFYFWLLNRGTEISYWTREERLIEMFPEFGIQKPEHLHEEGSWFADNDFQSRHLVLDRCIAECETLIKKRNQMIQKFYDGEATEPKAELPVSIPATEETEINWDEVFKTERWHSLKGSIGSIQYRFLKMNEAGNAIEANPSTHKIAQYVWETLIAGASSQKEEIGWVELKEGNQLPDYDEPALWLYEDGNVFVDSLDKDGNPHIFEGMKCFGQNDNLIRCTHWHPLPKLPESKSEPPEEKSAY